MTDPGRYGFDDLARAMLLTPHAAGKRLNLRGSQLKEARTRGMTVRVADRLANAAGFHPFEVWPTMADDEIDRAMEDCAEPTCGRRFLPRRSGHRYCSDACYARSYYAEHGERVRARVAGYYDENRDRIVERVRTRRAARSTVAGLKVVCAWCSSSFAPVRTTQKWCHPECRTAAQIERKAQARAKARVT